MFFNLLLIQIFGTHHARVQEGRSVLHLDSGSDFGKLLEVVATLLKYGAELSVVNQARRRHPCDSAWNSA